MTPKGRGRGAGGLRGLDAVPPSAPTSTAAGQPEQPAAEQNTHTEQPPARRQPAAVTPQALATPQVEIPRHERSNRTAQLNFRVTEEWRDWFGRQLKFIAAQTGLRDNQVSALAVQVLGDSVDEIRHRAMRMAGMVEPGEHDDE